MTSKKILIPLVIFGAFFLDVAPTGAEEEKAPPKTEAECTAAGGRWAIHGLSANKSCNLPTSDAEKTCRDSSDCEGECVAELSSSQEEMVKRGEAISIDGKCSKEKIVVGCLPFVMKGKVHGLLCRD